MSSWSRRDLLKTVGTGVVGLGVAGGVADQLGEYIVGTTAPDARQATAAVSTNGIAEIDLTAHTPLTLTCGRFTPARRETLAARSDVAFVHPDRRLTTLTAQDGETLPWGIDRVDADVAHDTGATGAGADVAVVDSGIDAGHPDLAANVAADGSESWVDCSGDCDHPWSDDGGHGTHVAGTIAATASDDGVIGVAPDATLHALKVCGSNGACRTSAMVAAIRHAADRGWDVANLSLGGRRPAPALQAAGEYALEAGLLPVASAGNRGSPDSVAYPAAYDEYLAVGATTIDDEIAEFSSRGPEVDLAAPGAAVCSATLDGHDTQSGTSMAAPHVTGAVAQLVAAGASPSEARDRLLATAEDVGASETAQGAGLVDVAAALGEESADDGTGDGRSCPA